MLSLRDWGNNAENGSRHHDGVKSRVDAITTSSPQPLIHIHHWYRSASRPPVRVITHVLTIHSYPNLISLPFHHMIISCSHLQYLPHGCHIHSPHVLTLIHANYVKTRHPIILLPSPFHPNITSQADHHPCGRNPFLLAILWPHLNLLPSTWPNTFSNIGSSCHITLYC